MSNQSDLSYQDKFSKNGSIFDKLKDESVETLLDRAGGWGPLQFKSFFFVMYAFQGINIYIYNLAYLELLPSLLCTTDGTEYHTCGSQTDQYLYEDTKYAHQAEMCVDGNLIGEDNWKVDYTVRRSLHNWMTEHKLYCMPRFYIGLFGSMYFLGVALQGLVLKFSDHYGRIVLIRVLACIQVVLTLLMYFVEDYRYYYALYCLIGLSAAKQMCLYMYVNEISTQKHRMLMNSFAKMADSSFVTIISSIYFILGGKNWRHLAIFAPILCIICAILSFFVYESPKYLHAKGKYKELAAYINESARQNGKNFRIEESLSLVSKSSNEKSDEAILKTQHHQAEYSIWNDLKQLKTLFNFIITVSIFSFVVFNYFMMGLYMKYAVGDIFVNTLFTSLSEVVAYLSATVLFELVGLRQSFIVFSGMSILFGIPLNFDIPIWIATGCLILTRFGAQAAFPSMHYLSNSGLFNPLFVPFLYGVGNLVAKIFTMFAPQIVELPRPIPMVSFLTTSFGILFCSLLIKM